MKKTTLSIVLLLMITLVAGQVQAANNAAITPTILSYTPVPAQPGNYVTVTIKLTNTGTDPANQAIVEFIDNYPFSVDNKADKREEIGTLGAKENYLVEYRVRIDSDAIEGRNYLKIRYTTNEAEDLWIEKELPLTISGVQKTVSINSVEVTPKMLTPGEEAEVTLKVKNLATSNLKDVGVKLNLEGALVGTTYVDIPLAPIGSSVEKRISSLRNGETADFTFVLQAYPQAEASIYKVPVTLTYTDDTGEEFTRTDLISIVINGPSDVLLQVDSTTLTKETMMGTLDLSITNKGFSEIKFLTITIEESDDYTIRSTSNKMYLGNVDSDDYELAEFDLSLTNTEQEQLAVPVILTFKDALNNEHTITETLHVALTGENGQGANKKTGTIVIVVLVLVILGFLIHRNKNKKHKK